MFLLTPLTGAQMPGGPSGAGLRKPVSPHPHPLHEALNTFSCWIQSLHPHAPWGTLKHCSTSALRLTSPFYKVIGIIFLVIASKGPPGLITYSAILASRLSGWELWSWTPPYVLNLLIRTWFPWGQGLNYFFHLYSEHLAQCLIQSNHLITTSLSHFWLVLNCVVPSSPLLTCLLSIDSVSFSGLISPLSAHFTSRRRDCFCGMKWRGSTL